MKMETGLSPERELEIFTKFTTATEPVAEYIWVGANLARMFLERNVEPQKGVRGTNRRSAPSTIYKYRDAMVRDEWVATTEGIGFSVEGRLIDGAHRLKALLMAETLNPGATHLLLVCGGLEVGSKHVIDMGRRRSMGQFLQMDGEVNINHLQSVLRLIYCHDNVPFSTVRDWEMYGSVTYRDMDALLAKFPEIRDFVNEALMLREVLRIPTAATALYLASKLDKKHPGVLAEARWFNARLEDGLGMEAWQPVYRLQRYLQKNYDTNDRVEQLAHWIKAFNAHLADKQDHVVYFREGESFPKIVVPKDYDFSKRPQAQSDNSAED